LEQFVKSNSNVDSYSAYCFHTARWRQESISMLRSRVTQLLVCEPGCWYFDAPVAHAEGLTVCDHLLQVLCILIMHMVQGTSHS